MTAQHIFYIPAIFLLGFVLGILTNDMRRGIIASGPEATINIYDQLQYKVSGKKLFLTFLIFLLVFLITHTFDIPWGVKAVGQKLGGLPLFDRQPVFSSTEVYDRVKLFPAEGLLAYKRFTYTTDILFPVSFIFFLFTFARFVAERTTTHNYLAKILIALPFSWFAFDLLENTMLFSILSKFPNQSDLLGSSLGLVTAIKFGLLLLSILTPSLLIIFGNKRLG